MKKKIALLTVATLLLFGACSNNDKQNKKIIVTEEDIEYELSFVSGEYKMSYPLEELKKEIKESLIEQKLFEAEAIALGYHKDIEFSREIEKIKREMLISRLINEKIIKSVSISDQELKDFYNEYLEDFIQDEQVRASHIIIDTRELDEKEKLEAKVKAEKILKRALSEENFALLAIETSEGPTGPNGGDLGWFGRGQMIEEFEEAAFNGEKGKVYPEIVETIYGYHVIYVEDKSEKEYIPYESIKETLREEVLNMKRYELYLAYIEELKEKYNIEN